MNRNFILGCLAGAIGGIIGTWMILFIDIKITLRDFSFGCLQKEVNPKVNPREIVGVLLEDDVFQEFVDGFKDKGEVDLVLIPNQKTNQTTREGRGIHAVVAPVPTGDVFVKSKFVNFKLKERRKKF